ncbi:hypothetical protein SCUCBS95973_005528 [Sporothrix curviconia]|uniref:NWD NACHT-NTPase N-terminal domain-containing protein n=1 Tax=Sporothrix curviconia TaxID=1260050 RepID=A0ABP0BXN0_9PEZI
MIAPDQADADVPKDQTRKEQLDAIVDKGLQQAGEKKLTCTIAGHEFDLGDKIYKAADAILWAKDFIGDAAKASPEASAVWAGVCLVLPLLTALKTAAEANDSGFTYVTTRMRYYTALEPLLHKLGQNKGCDKSLVAEISENIVKLYEKILSFQIQSILRFYYSLAKGYAKDVMSQKKWKQMQLEIEQLETTIHSDLIQVGDLAARQELEQLNETARKSCEAMTGLLSISKQQLATARERLAVSQETRDIAQQQLQAQQAAALQALTDKEEECIRSFRLTSNNENTTYEWYKNSVPDRVENTCKWFLQHDDYQRWLRIVLDALDECKNVDFEFLMKKVQRHFVEKNNTRLKVLMTSRPYDQIMEELQPLLDIFDDRIHIPGESESEMISEEVNYVIEYRVDELARRKRLPANVKAHLAKTMLAVQHRTYLWVHLIFDYLKTDLFKKTKRGIEAAISTLPKTVDDAYEQILARSKDDPRVRKILAIILAASRPLTVSEMNVAVNFEGDMRDLTGDLEDEDEDSDMEDDASFKDSLRSLCGLFVSVYDDSVHLIHLTAREFLLRKDEEHSLSSSSVQALSPSNPSSPGPLAEGYFFITQETFGLTTSDLLATLQAHLLHNVQ